MNNKTWQDEAKAGEIPPAPQPQGNRSYNVTVTFVEGVSEYSQVKKVDMAPGMMVMKFRDKEVIVPMTKDIREIEISEAAILS